MGRPGRMEGNARTSPRQPAARKPTT
jgi:hypothetical protein